MVLPLVASAGPAIGGTVEWSVRAQLQVEVQRVATNCVSLCLFSLVIYCRGSFILWLQDMSTNGMDKGVWYHKDEIYCHVVTEKNQEAF
jgi:hypothetical protein